MAILESKELVRYYGSHLAVDRVSFEVERGEIFAFLGPNGAGKTTTVRMLTGFFDPSSGTGLINGRDIVREPIDARRHIGVVPEEANVYVDLTVWQNVMLMAELHRIDKKTRHKRGRTLLEAFDLYERRDEDGRTLSKGLKQRLMICMALVSAPDLLFLDEPTSGLDVKSARLIRDTIVRMNKDEDMTVFLTTHNIGEAEQLCDRVAIIDEGRIAAIDTPDALRSVVASRRSVEVTFCDGDCGALSPEGLEGVEEVKPLSQGFKIYSASPGRVAQQVASSALEKGLEVQNIRTLEPSLEDVFVHITSEKNEEKQNDE